MNIEIANRLVELRKKAGLSQEELALSLGVSRQAVSKWERAESSPDTDNLICLACLYHCSLDELVGIDVIKEEPKNNEEEKRIDIGENGVYLKNGNKQIDVNHTGVHIRGSNGDELHFGSQYYDFGNTKLSPEYAKLKRRVKISNVLGFLIFFITTIVYILVGSIQHTWHPTWLLFLIAIDVISLIDAICKRNFHVFAFPFFAATIYLILGFYFKLWHPGWVVFLFIPVYYVLTPKSKKKVIFRKINGETVKDFQDPKTVDNVIKVCQENINE